jgi:gentisate 1,2-dioxygenase
MAAKHLKGFWLVEENVLPYPRTTVQPYLWRWDDVSSSLERAGQLVGLERADRRVVLLQNPGLPLWPWTTPTIHLSLQYLQPGEHAVAHRHTFAAFRFILKGHGAYTTVDGQQCLMEQGDLILTPQRAWHDHTNPSAEPIVWLDGLDLPLVFSIHQFAQEYYPQPAQPIQAHSDQATLISGDGRALDRSGTPFYHYKWRDTAAALQALVERNETADRFDGHCLEFRHPLTGGPTLPSMQCTMHLLRADQRTEAHRHTSTVIYHVVRGAGTPTIEGQRVEWGPGDSFVVPLWHAHHHANRSSVDDAILFAMSDAPLLRSLDLYREEPVARSEDGAPAFEASA